MLCVKWNWLYIYVYHFRFDVRKMSVFIPIVKVGEYGDYHTIVWLCFYVILGRELHKLEATIKQVKSREQVDRVA